MTPSITDRSGLLTDELRQLAERRLLFALSRFDDRITRVDLVVSDENGPRGGIDKACRITVALNQARDVIVRHKDVDMAKAISRIAERAGRAVSRAIEKTQSFERIRPIFYDDSVVSL
ncbi:MAG: HPF/RaiA family ribosome-associated protein [Rubripirellula sp.]